MNKWLKLVIIMRFTFIISIILSSAFVIADADCDNIGSDRPEYELICGSSDMDGELNELSLKVESNKNFILKWRISENSDPNITSDLENIKKVIDQASAAIDTLAEINCRLELGLGGRVATGGQSINREYCLREYTNKQKMMLYEKLVDYTHVIKPSYDCEKASGEIELAICKEVSLAILDREISEYYSKISTDIMVRNEQRKWLNETREKCLKNSDMVDCLRSVMRDRSKLLYEASR